MFTSRMVLPDNKLTNWIKVYWFLKGDGKGEKKVLKRILPDGCATILLVLNGKMKFEIFDNQVLTNGIYVIPPILKSYNGLISDDFFSIDVQLNPGIFYKLFNLPVLELEKTIYTFDDLSLKFDKNVIDKLKDIEENKTLLFKELNNILIKLFNQNNFSTDHIVSNIHNLYTSGNLNKFFDDQNLSIRQLERKVKNFTGLTPKNISRLGRFYVILEKMKYYPLDFNLTELAYDNKFADQSHFIREFKSLSEITPRQFLKDINTYPQYTGLCNLMEST